MIRFILDSGWDSRIRDYWVKPLSWYINLLITVATGHARKIHILHWLYIPYVVRILQVNTCINLQIYIMFIIYAYFRYIYTVLNMLDLYGRYEISLYTYVCTIHACDRIGKDNLWTRESYAFESYVQVH